MDTLLAIVSISGLIWIFTMMWKDKLRCDRYTEAHNNMVFHWNRYYWLCEMGYIETAISFNK